MHWQRRSARAALRPTRNHERNTRTAVRIQDPPDPESGNPRSETGGRATPRGCTPAGARASPPRAWLCLGRQRHRQHRLGRPGGARAGAARDAGGRRRRDLHLAAEPARRGDRGSRRAAPHRRPADRRLPRSRVPELAEEARRRRGGMMRRFWLLLALVFAGTATAEPPVDVAPKVAAKKPAAKPAAKAKAMARPAWAELTAEQQKTLAPLKADWESLETERRRKWIGIAKRYPTMKAEEQARETYKQIVKAPPEQRDRLRQQWAEYQQLSPREREDIVPEHRRKK